MKNIALNDGNSIPQVGLGTFLLKGDDCVQIVEHAIKMGYRHLDLAKLYANQREIGVALKKVIPEVVSREDLFITSKLWNNAHKPQDVGPTLDETLEELGLEYLDLYLMHWPVAFDAPPGELSASENGVVKLDLNTSVVDTWKAMIELKKTGKVKSIGVSNFRPDIIDAITEATGVAPAVNQIEAHPMLPQDKLVEHHRAKNIHITAYAPLGNNNALGRSELVNYPQITSIAQKRGVDPGQVLLAWGTQRGYSVIPKTASIKRVESNYEQIKLTEEEYNLVSSIPKEAGGPQRFFLPFASFKSKWDINIFDDPAEKDATHQIKVK